MEVPKVLAGVLMREETCIIGDAVRVTVAGVSKSEGLEAKRDSMLAFVFCERARRSVSTTQGRGGWAAKRDRCARRVRARVPMRE